MHMTTNSALNQLRKGLTILQRDGFISMIRAGLRTLNLNYQGYWWYLKYLYRTWVCRNCQTMDPFNVVYVPPDRITHQASERIDRWDDLGAVIKGNWDRSGQPVESLIKYRSVVDHFENGTPWEETEIYREAMSRIGQGEPYWNGSLTEEDVNRRVAHIENLYESIQTQGFKSQEEIHGKPLREIVLSRHFDRSKEEIAVAIGRNGEFLFVDGNHRLAIANILELDSIPVHVVARHSLYNPQTSTKSYSWE